jgi:serine/threonine protein kinase
LDILIGLNEIHKNNIIHCDIKPQNFLLFYEEESENYSSLNESFDINDQCSVSSIDTNTFLKITDFGLAHLIPSGQKKALMKVRCGTFGYCAPEITKDANIDTSIDMWAFGLCLYQMAVAYLPTAIKQYKYGSGPLPYRKADWNTFNFEQIKDLIDSCVQMKPEKRISAREAMQHPWFEI